MEDPNKNPEPQNEKGDEKENSNENQPESETPAPEEKPITEEKAPEVPEGFIPKEQFDELEEKYRNSSSEALILREQLKEKDSRRELTNEPAESDVRAAFPEVDWDYADPATKVALREAYRARTTAEALREKDLEREAAAKRNTDLELVIAQNPSLLGKEQAFKDFANMPTHRAAPLNVLVDAFLHKSGIPTAPTAPKTPVATLESGNGGPRGPVSTKEYTAEEMTAIQASDPRKYRDLLLAGAFDE